MRKEIIDELIKITPEEQEILNGRTDVDTALYNLSASMIVDAKAFLEQGRLIELRPHTRFIHFPKHTHNYVEAVYMCSGQTTHIINGNTVLLKEGELLFLSQNATQEILPASYSDIAVNFFILPEFLDRTLDMIRAENNLIRTFLTDCLKSGNGQVSYLHFKVADVLPIQNLVENLIWMLLHRQPNKRSLNQTTVGLLFLHLLNFTDKMEIGKDHLDQELTFTVLGYIEEHYRDGELSVIAQKYHYDLYQLSRMIKNTTGRTWTELLQEKRLNQAAYLLRTTALSITDIGLDVGYSNFSYFYKIFRQKYGCSPREYRKKVLSASN
ncbi:MAG: helix-turn-helix domain-containing protein [Lachnospiraceae bacterium]|nr:helix-turn-helix domain-containing protein [Lachnospiraceae bacterium]